MTASPTDRNLVGWFEIYVDDLDRAQRFYETVFQITLTPLETPVPGLRCLAFPHNFTRYGAGGALVRMDGVCAGGSSTIVYFHSEDCAVEQSRALDAGGTLVREKFAIPPHGAIALIRDSEGNLIGLHSLS